MREQTSNFWWPNQLEPEVVLSRYCVEMFPHGDGYRMNEPDACLYAHPTLLKLMALVELVCPPEGVVKVMLTGIMMRWVV